jgi:hypothetical protein
MALIAMKLIFTTILEILYRKSSCYLFGTRSGGGGFEH